MSLQALNDQGQAIASTARAWEGFTAAAKRCARRLTVRASSDLIEHLQPGGFCQRTVKCLQPAARAVGAVARQQTEEASGVAIEDIVQLVLGTVAGVGQEFGDQT